MNEEHVTFTGDGLEFEGILHLPDGKPPFPAVAICHPHPLYGGDMHNNVVVAICHALVKDSIAALRFNFRGVGRSQGNYSGGIGETEDLKAALTFLGMERKLDSDKIGLAGYSFGTIVILPVALNCKQVKAVTLVSPVISDDAWQQLDSYEKPILFLSGSEDHLISSDNIRQKANQLPGPVHCEIVTGADHFWWGYEEEISLKTLNFFYTYLKV